MSKKRSRQQSKQAVNTTAFSSIRTDVYLKPVTENHRLFRDSIMNKDITFCIGPAGTGKTTIAAQTACHLINSDSNDINRIVYIRSNIGTADEKPLGALKGDFQDKIAPLAKPLIDGLLNIMPQSEVEAMFQFSKIEAETLYYLRGRSFRNAIVIVDEIENFTLHGFKTVLTRVESSCKLVLLGDPEQSDLFKHNNKSDLCIKVAKALSHMTDCVGTVFFNEKDIVRNPLISDILEALSTVE